MVSYCYHDDSFIDDDVSNGGLGKEEGRGVPPPVCRTHLHTQRLDYNHRLWAGREMIEGMRRGKRGRRKEIVEMGGRVIC